MKKALRQLRKTARLVGGGVAGRVLSPRPVKVVGMGTAKSGTHSIAHLFSRDYRSFHEPASSWWIPLILAYQTGQVARKTLIRKLRLWDGAVYPTADVANYYGEIPGELAEAFPHARFLITLRDCYTWVQSQINQTLVTRAETGEQGQRKFLLLEEARLGAPGTFPYGEEAAAFKALGLAPLAAWMHHWAIHNRRMLEHIPEERRLVVRTREIREKIPEIAAFLGLPAGTLDAGRAHAFRRNTLVFNLADAVPPAYLEDIAQQYCGDLMSVYFPDVQRGEQELDAGTRDI